MKELTSQSSNFFFVTVSLILIVSITLFVSAVLISFIIAPVKTEPFNHSMSVGLPIAGFVILLLPIFMASIVIRIRHIVFDHTGIHFGEKTVNWRNIDRITIFSGNSSRFTIQYSIGNKNRKVFGALPLFKKTDMINKLYKISKDYSVPVKKWWI